MTNQFIYEYFYNFLKFTLLFNDPDHIKKYYTKKFEYKDKMLDICSQNNLKDLDYRFFDMAVDLDEVILLNRKDITGILNDYKDFISKY